MIPITIAILLMVSLFVAVGLARLVSLERRAGNQGRLTAQNDSLRQEFCRLEGLEQEVARLEEVNRQVLAALGVEADGDRPGEMRREEADLEEADSHREWRRTPPSLAPRSGPISRGFGASESEAVGHEGVDVPGKLGSPVVAAGGGIVEVAGQDEVFGNMIVIDHGMGLRTVYGHNHELLVSVGDSVSRGQRVATLGNTGRSSAPHLHFEVREDGVPVDPGLFIREYTQHVKKN